RSRPLAKVAINGVTSARSVDGTRQRVNALSAAGRTRNWSLKAECHPERSEGSVTPRREQEADPSACGLRMTFQGPKSGTPAVARCRLRWHGQTTACVISPSPFTLHVEDEVLNDLRQRLER